MSVNSRLHNIERSLRYRELALLWLKTSQERGGLLASLACAETLTVPLKL